MEDNAVLRRALEYPYARPSSSYVFCNGAVLHFENEHWKGIQSLWELTVQHQGAVQAASAPCSLREALKAHGYDAATHKDAGKGWMPVLAIGSNAAPEQLVRKFASMFPDVCIPVVECVLEGFDVVYSPYVTGYGSCPATLAHSPGTFTSVYITYLTPTLAECMHMTEGVPTCYSFMHLRNIKLHVAASIKSVSSETEASLPSFEVVPEVFQYNYARGALSMPMECPTAGVIRTQIALAEIPARFRRFPALTQADVLEFFMHALDGVHLEDDEQAAYRPSVSEKGHLFPVPFRRPPVEHQPAAGVSQPEEGDGKATRLREWVLRNINKYQHRNDYVKRLHEHASTAFTYEDYVLHDDLSSLHKSLAASEGVDDGVEEVDEWQTPYAAPC